MTEEKAGQTFEDLIAALSIQDKKHEEEDKVVPCVLETLDLAGIAKAIRSGACKRIITMCGAGISVSAGIPDFRTPGTGLYSTLASYNLPVSVYQKRERSLAQEAGGFFSKKKSPPEPPISISRHVIPNSTLKQSSVLITSGRIRGRSSGWQRSCTRATSHRRQHTGWSARWPTVGCCSARSRRTSTRWSRLRASPRTSWSMRTGRSARRTVWTAAHRTRSSTCGRPSLQTACQPARSARAVW
jgi:hypothetical protein